jgi:pimeloyl-ACP methyl ester carboxylesterase
MTMGTNSTPASALPPEIRKHFPFASRFMRVNGHRMHYVDEGEGDPVLLLHGNPTWSFLYRKFIPRIVAAGYRVIAPDHIGFGLSDRPAREHDFSLENHVANLAEFIRRLGLRRLTVVCQDWGGPTGLACTVLDPGAFKAVVVMNTWAWSEPTAFHSSVFPWRMMHAPVVGPYLFQRRNILVERGLYLSVVHQEQFLEEALPAYRFVMPDYDSRLLTRVFPRLIPLQPDDRSAATMRWLEQSLRGLHIPALIVWGKEEIVFPAECAQRFKALLPHAKGPLWVTGSHFLQEDSPQEICGHILDFLREQDGGKQP